jgi:hypothetical protein
MDPVGRIQHQVMTMRGGALAAVVLCIVACSIALAPPASPPTEEAARGYLDSIVAMVESGNPLAICEVASGTCEQILRTANMAAVPSSPPTVIGSRVIQPVQNPDGTSSLGGRVLELCGRDGLDEPYYSEILVFEDGGRLLSTATPYWLGYGIAETHAVGASTPRPSCP